MRVRAPPTVTFPLKTILVAEVSVRLPLRSMLPDMAMLELLVVILELMVVEAAEVDKPVSPVRLLGRVKMPPAKATSSPEMVELEAKSMGPTDEIETLAQSDDGCRRVMTVPGIGPVI